MLSIHLLPQRLALCLDCRRSLSLLPWPVAGNRQLSRFNRTQDGVYTIEVKESSHCLAFVRESEWSTSFEFVIQVRCVQLMQGECCKRWSTPLRM